MPQKPQMPKLIHDEIDQAASAKAFKDIVSLGFWEAIYAASAFV